MQAELIRAYRSRNASPEPRHIGEPVAIHPVYRDHSAVPASV
jgi:hypothetical protein